MSSMDVTAVRRTNSFSNQAKFVPRARSEAILACLLEIAVVKALSVDIREWC